MKTQAQIYRGFYPEQEDILEVAQWLYDNEVNEWHLFTNDELKYLWDMYCVYRTDAEGKLIDPRAFDDEVHDEMFNRGLFN